MSEVFVVRNQLGHFWGKKKRWVDGRKAARIMTVKHQDEGLNLLVELSAKDVELRGEVVPVETNDRGVPQVEASEHHLEDADDIAAQVAKEAADATEEGSDATGAEIAEDTPTSEPVAETAAEAPAGEETQSHREPNA